MRKLVQAYKKNILQVIGFTLGFLIFHKPLLLVFALVLLLLLLAMPAQAVVVTSFIDKIIEFIGKVIKNILLFLTYVIVVVPLSLTMRIFGKKKTVETGSYYVMRNNSASPTDMTKMW